MPVGDGSPARQHYWLTLAILTAGALAYSLMQTMVVPALPQFQAELDTTATWSTWILTGFLLSSAVLTPLLGKLGDQRGKERLLVLSLAIFLAGVVGAVFAWDIWSLIVFRMVQGAGGAIFPLAFAIIRDELPREKVGIGIGLVSATLGIGAGLGIVLSGVIVDALSWRYLFVVTAVALVLTHRFVPESPVKTPSRIDLTGAALFSAGLVCLLLALTEGEGWGWTSAAVIGLLTAAAALLVVWVLAERRIENPLVDMRVFFRRPVLLTNTTALIAGFAMFGSFTIVPTFVESPRLYPPELARLVDYGFGATVTQAGLYLLPSSLAMLVAGPFAGVLGRRIGDRRVLALGMACIAVGAAMFPLLHEASWHVLAMMLVVGVGIAFSFAALPKLITDAVSQTETGIATGMNTVMRTVGGVVGGQVAAAILASHTVGAAGIPSESAFTTAFWIAAAVAVVGVPTALLVAPRARGPAGAVAPAEP